MRVAHIYDHSARGTALPMGSRRANDNTIEVEWDNGITTPHLREELIPVAQLEKMRLAKQRRRRDDEEEDFRSRRSRDD